MKRAILFLIMILLASGCSSNAKDKITGDRCVDSNTCSLENKNSAREINIDKLEIYHFHGTHQCYSCITVGKYAEETVNTYFADELKSGKIVFAHINGELPENRELVMKYGVNSASLWLGTYTKDGKFSAEQNINVWYKISNKEDYMTYLKGIIEQKLAGD
ncbi:MAG: nitrophenyl compound nitroreductase subunit ArsF family protein [Candidatus Aenigmatarchaeota archaeon]